MRPCVALAIITAEIPNTSPSHQDRFPRELESALMGQFYAAISDDGIFEFSKKHTVRDYCDWDGVTCGAGFVCQVRYYNKQYGKFDVHTLPSTVENLSIQCSQQKYAIQTRALPRELQTCTLSFNLLFGSVDLRTLPANLVLLDLSSNLLAGPIQLTRLPCALERLHLCNNRIVQSVVFYDNLPPTVTVIQLISHADETNRIGKVCAVHPDKAVKNTEVFLGILQKNVR